MPNCQIDPFRDIFSEKANQGWNKKKNSYLFFSCREFYNFPEQIEEYSPKSSGAKTNVNLGKLFRIYVKEFNLSSYIQ